jgi:hypothetical protein
LIRNVIGSVTSMDCDNSLTTSRHLGVWLAIKRISDLSSQFRPLRRDGFSAGREEDLWKLLIGTSSPSALIRSASGVMQENVTRDRAH